MVVLVAFNIPKRGFSVNSVLFDRYDGNTSTTYIHTNKHLNNINKKCNKALNSE